MLLAHLYPLHVLASHEAASYISEGLLRGNTVVRKRLLKTLLWVVNAGDLEAVEHVAAEV